MACAFCPCCSYSIVWQSKHNNDPPPQTKKACWVFWMDWKNSNNNRWVVLHCSFVFSFFICRSWKIRLLQWLQQQSFMWIVGCISLVIGILMSEYFFLLRHRGRDFRQEEKDAWKAINIMALSHLHLRRFHSICSSTEQQICDSYENSS